MITLVTGAAGFIGSHVVSHLANQGERIVGLDNFSNYYSRELKELRCENLITGKAEMHNCDLNDVVKLEEIFREYKPTTVIHLAAQAGVRLKGKDLDSYVNSNITGFHNLIQCCLRQGVGNFLFASSSSVYGNSKNELLRESNTDIRPISFYGSTKLFNELAMHSYIRETPMRAIGMRFFTVYGAWGRPDMAYFRIASNLLSNQEFRMFGSGQVKRDFTYIQDVVNSVTLLKANIEKIPIGTFEIFNIGGGRPCSLNELISELEVCFEKKLRIKELQANPNDVISTNADFSKLLEFTGYKPTTDLTEGIENIAHWFRSPDIRNRLLDWINSAP